MNDQDKMDMLDTIWSNMGLTPQSFPVYYSIGPVPLVGAGGVTTGAIGARARLSKGLSNEPHMFVGVRISNSWALPDDPTALDIEKARYFSDYLDAQQTVTINLSQQNITASDGALQLQLDKPSNGDWHPFPTPFPMAGGNNVSLEVVRTQSYPAWDDDTLVQPTVFATLVTVQFKADRQTVAVHRAGP